MTSPLQPLYDEVDRLAQDRIDRNARIAELEAENRELREELRKEREYAEDRNVWLDKALAALGVETVFDIPEVGA